MRVASNQGIQMLRRIFVAVILLSAASPALAAFSWQPYTEQSFVAEQEAGKVILVAVHADWCPTCRAQGPILESLMAEPAMAEVVPVRVNFDQDKDFLAAHQIQQQSTILIFKGSTEVARTVGETDAGRLQAFVADAVGG